MKKIAIIALAVLSLAACNKKAADALAEAVKNVSINCTPEVLEVVNDTVRAQVEVNYPAGYFSKDAQVIVAPYVVWEGGEMALQPFLYQGEAVKDNNKVVPSAGGTVRETIVFPYRPAMSLCRLELRSTAFIGGKEVPVPVIKVADGCINLARWADRGGVYTYKADGYQEKVVTTAEGQILYDVNSSAVKGSQLGNASIKKLQGAIAEGAESERITVKGTKIISYASPEGGEELNDKLSQERSEAAQKAWKQIGKGAEAGSTEIKSVGQDWEGFQEAIKASNLEDKDLILRVLSMYSDPAVRESEIKNLSQVYTEIKEQVFPELRRSRFITELEYQNYSEADLQRLLEHKRLYLLDEEAILRLAALTDSLELKQTLYRAAAERMGSQRGQYNLAVTLLDKQSYSAAEVYFDKLKDQSDADLLNARGVIALHGGKVAEATGYFEKSGTPEAKQNLGLVALLKGDSQAAASQLEGAGSRNEAIVKISKKDYAGAVKLLEDEGSAEALYLAAVASARKGDKAGVDKYLKAACEKDPSLRDTALKDIEFAGFEI
ncbi:MAG: hypothetical protein II891_05030 [Bacteroidales bacterium]|nr:hypothetical protein [Bacteroidales bacterium]